MFSIDFIFISTFLGLFYLNRMEWAASAMEMSVISARNIANLAERHVTRARDSRVEL